MKKNMQTHESPSASHTRLAEISALTFGTLSDSEVLGLLAERKHLQELERTYAQAQAAEARIREQEEEKKRAAEARQRADLQAQIETLNHSISPDKADAELLKLVAERQALEKELEDLGKKTAASDDREERGKQDITSAVKVSDTLGGDGTYEGRASLELTPEFPATATPVETLDTAGPAQAFKQSLKEEFGHEGIMDDGFAEGSELHRYLDQLKNNTGSLGTLLQEMPLEAKKNKQFMLKVAEIDSAYAMHYADSDTLKRDEEFNIKIASMKNNRNSGNALAEMLPEARTSKVVLAAVRQDYRNVKFLKPEMEDYDEILNMAKKATLEKLRDLKEATDISLLIPKPLQQDHAFMAEIEQLGETRQAQSAAKPS